MTNDKIAQKIENYFPVPERVQDKVRNIVEKTRGGYMLIETRPPWDGSNRPWSKLPVAKIIFHKPSSRWRLYWMRASGKWERYPTRAKSLEGILKVIKEDKCGCFWG